MQGTTIKARTIQVGFQCSDCGEQWHLEIPTKTAQASMRPALQPVLKSSSR
jgi:hypothetical protein